MSVTPSCFVRGVCWLSAWLLVGSGVSQAADDVRPPDFDREIAPLLTGRCLGCHGHEDHKGGLDLSRRGGLEAGGDSGPVVTAGKLDESLLWERIEADEMPPKKPLSAGEKELIRRWIVSGAKWGTDPIDPFRYSSESRAGVDWWSLQPLQPGDLPAVKQAGWALNPIDHYVLAQLEEHGLVPAPLADRRTQIRRLSFDLRGMPPTPAEVAAFLADSNPRAYDDLVERYLNAPEYGERWARHWLDIVRFGESQGFERDKLRPNSWRYRDWVVQALNRDLPYDEFIRLQIAGDVVRPDDPWAVVATGFLVAAPWDEVGQSQQSEAMRKVVRQDELEDVIGVTCQTFLGLTANCARCHDHKFDPVSQAEYYQLSAVLGGVRHGDRESLSSTGKEGLVERTVELEQRQQELTAQLAGLLDPIRQRLEAEQTSDAAPTLPVPSPIARWEFDGDLKDSLGQLHGTAHGQARMEAGRLVLDGKESFVTTAPLQERPLTAKTLEVSVQLANLTQQGGGVMSIQTPDGSTFDAIVFGEREPGKWLPGSNGFVRTTDLAEAAPETTADREVVQMTLVYDADRTITMYRNGRPYGRPYQTNQLATFNPSQTQIVFGMRHAPAGGNRMLAGSIERAQLYDRALTSAEVAASAGVREVRVTTEMVLTALTTEQRARHDDLLRRSTQIAAELRLLRGGSTYAVTPREPEATHILSRGNPGSPLAAVAPQMLQALGDWSHEFNLPAETPEGQRRARFADWLTDKRNPLTPRVMANRLWQYHFGHGLVETPNDFGFNGGRPTHPRLLDWLAVELQREWSLKHVHRLIVTSATYRQASRVTYPAALQQDADNRWLWHKSPLRLEAEMLRDSVLAVSGALNPTMGGPGFQDFKTFTSNSQFYEMFDPVGYEFQRRSLYRTWVRSGRSPFLDVLDCPDPSVTSPKRAVTTTPLQALALLNNSFLLRMSDRCAEHVSHLAAEQDVPSLVTSVYQLLFQREPSEKELALGVDFVAQHGLAAYCRVLFNSNEFLYID